MERQTKKPHASRIVYFNGEPCYFTSRLQSRTDEGERGDVRLRPVRLGNGPYTFVTSADACENEDGSPAFPN